jgi:hypothetical protein
VWSAPGAPIIEQKLEDVSELAFVGEPLKSTQIVSGAFRVARRTSLLIRETWTRGVTVFEQLPDGRLFHLTYWLGRASYASDATDMSDESIAEAGEPLQVRWHTDSFLAVPIESSARGHAAPLASLLCIYLSEVCERVAVCQDDQPLSMSHDQPQRYDAGTALPLQPRFAQCVRQSGVRSMKLLSLTLAACFVLAGYAYAQTPAQTPAPSESQPAPSSSSGHSISRSCRSEIHKLCGHAHGDEMKGCVKDNLDMNKFSADCTTEIKAHAPAPAPKPAS